MCLKIFLASYPHNNNFKVKVFYEATDTLVELKSVGALYD